VPVLAIAASIVLLTQQSAQIWQLGAAFVVAGTVLFLIARLTGTWVEQEPREATPRS
jgi:hypothetical protein